MMRAAAQRSAAHARIAATPTGTCAFPIAQFSIRAPSALLILPPPAPIGHHPLLGRFHLRAIAPPAAVTQRAAIMATLVSRPGDPQALKAAAAAAARNPFA